MRFGVPAAERPREAFATWGRKPGKGTTPVREQRSSINITKNQIVFPAAAGRAHACPNSQGGRVILLSVLGGSVLLAGIGIGASDSKTTTTTVPEPERLLSGPTSLHGSRRGRFSISLRGDSSP